MRAFEKIKIDRAIATLAAPRGGRAHIFRPLNIRFTSYGSSMLPCCRFIYFFVTGNNAQVREAEMSDIERVEKLLEMSVAPVTRIK
jgi:hypothetical protein